MRRLLAIPLPTPVCATLAAALVGCAVDVRDTADATDTTLGGVYIEEGPLAAETETTRPAAPQHPTAAPAATLPSVESRAVAAAIDDADRAMRSAAARLRASDTLERWGAFVVDSAQSFSELGVVTVCGHEVERTEERLVCWSNGDDSAPNVLDARDLAALPRLRELLVMDVAITHPEALEQVTTLRTLEIGPGDGCGAPAVITAVPPLATLARIPGLETLALDLGNALDEFPPPGECPDDSLTAIRVRANLAPLAASRSLRTLRVATSGQPGLAEVSGVDAVLAAGHVKALVLNNVVAPDAAEGLAQGALERFDASGASGFSLREVLQGAASLRELTVSTADARGLEAIAHAAPNLRSLEIGEATVRHLGPLARLAHLERLVLNSSTLRDLSALRGLPLRHLALAGIPARSFAALRGAPLETVDLSSTHFSNLADLAGAEGTLTQLDLSFTPVSERGASFSRLTRFGALGTLTLLGSRFAECAAVRPTWEGDEGTPLEAPECKTLDTLSRRPTFTFAAYEGCGC